MARRPIESPDSFEMPVGKYCVFGEREANCVRIVENTPTGAKLLLEGDLDTLQRLGLALMSITTCVKRA